MNKKVILKIESYAIKDGLILFSVSDHGVRSVIKDIVDLCNAKYRSYIMCEMSPPYKKRTTGVKSQNSHIWGHIQQISQSTGNDIDDVEEYIKMKAVSRGYPYHINKLTGEMRPVSMKTINTVEAGYLIDELHQLAAEMEITLYES